MIENLIFFSSSGVSVGTRIEEYMFCTKTTIVLWRNTFLSYLSTLKKKDNPQTEHSLTFQAESLSKDTLQNTAHFRF